MFKYFIFLLTIGLFTSAPTFAQSPGYFSNLYSIVVKYKSTAKYNIQIGLAITDEFIKAIHNTSLNKAKKAARLFELTDKARAMVEKNKNSAPHMIFNNFNSEINQVRVQIALYYKNNDIDALKKAESLVESYQSWLKMWNYIL